jgi:hypothetical protein
MAYVESAVVVYLRRIFGIADLIRSAPRFDPTLGSIELGRELATLVMLAAVARVAGKRLQSSLGFGLFAFGVWDIFYYIWLVLFIGWPRGLLDPDLLFLIPLPWWGPVLSPGLIAVAMAAFGALAVVAEDRGLRLRVSALDAALLALGSLAMLYAFMADAIAILPADARRLSSLRPGSFDWPVFLAGWATAVFAAGRVLRHGRRASPPA